MHGCGLPTVIGVVALSILDFAYVLPSLYAVLTAETSDCAVVQP